jgi:pimeloyl-ACP methyl ester carboxylesterase
MKKFMTCSAAVCCFLCAVVLDADPAHALAPPSSLSTAVHDADRRNTLVMRAIEDRCRGSGGGPLDAARIEQIKEEVAAEFPDVRWFRNDGKFEYAIDHRYFLAAYAAGRLALISQPTDYIIERWDNRGAVHTLRVMMCHPENAGMIRGGLREWHERNMYLFQSGKKLLDDIGRGPRHTRFSPLNTDLFFAVLSEDGAVQGLSRLSAGDDGDVYIAARAVLPAGPGGDAGEYPSVDIDLEYLAFRFAQRDRGRIDNTRFRQIGGYLRTYPFFSWGYAREGNALCVLDPARIPAGGFNVDRYFRDLYESGVSIRLHNTIIPAEVLPAEILPAPAPGGRASGAPSGGYRTTPEQFTRLAGQIKTVFTGARLRGSDGVEYEVMLKNEREAPRHRSFVFELYLYDPRRLETGLYFMAPFGFVRGNLADDTLTIENVNLAKGQLAGKGLYRNLFKMIGKLIPAGYRFQAYNVIEKHTVEVIGRAFLFDGIGKVARDETGRPLMRYAGTRELIDHTFVGRLHLLMEVEPFEVSYKDLRGEDALAQAAEDIRAGAYPGGIMVFSGRKLRGTDNGVPFERLCVKPSETLAQLYSFLIRGGRTVQVARGRTWKKMPVEQTMRRLARGMVLPFEIETPSLTPRKLLPAPAAPAFEDLRGAADYFPLTQKGMRIARSVLAALRKGNWDRAVSLFLEYHAGDTSMMKLVQRAGLEPVLASGSREEQIALISACMIACPLQQTAPFFSRYGEPLVIKLRDGTLLRGYFIQSSDRRRARHPTIILLSPWSMNIRALRPQVDFFRKAGFNVVPIDHRHHGGSQGAFFGFAQTGGGDLNETALFLLAHAKRYAVDPQYLLAYGVSIGGAIALDAAVREGSPLTHVIAQGVPDITDAFLVRNFSKLFVQLPKDIYAVRTIGYIKKLLKAGLSYYGQARMTEEDVLPQVLQWLRNIRVPCLYIRELDDTFMPADEYRDKIEPLVLSRGQLRAARIGGEHARGHLEDVESWEKTLDDFLTAQQIPFISRQIKIQQLLLFESVPAPSPLTDRVLDDGRSCEEAS